MTATPERPIVVGVDGSDQSMQAVRYAVQEAQRQSCGLTLVHALPENVPVAPMLPLVSVETLDQVGHRLVTQAEIVVHDLTDGQIAVEKVVRPGSRARVLADAGQNARMIVLGHRDRSVLGRVFTSSTCTGVSARAHCPVVSVPSAWEQGSSRGRVVVGIDGPAHSSEPLAVAFAEAAERGSVLTVLHAWKLQSPYDDIIASRVSLDAWRRSTTSMLEELLREWREAYPEVVVELDVRHEFTATALVEASEGADLLVLGRRGHGAPLGLFLGSIARTLIREARCPVEVAPARRDLEAAPADRFVTADEVAPQI
jgi:nucleotide-binding universal stress UspA family protein